LEEKNPVLEVLLKIMSEVFRPVAYDIPPLAWIPAILLVGALLVWGIAHSRGGKPEEDIEKPEQTLARDD
jgi:hypothetical protein